MDAALVAVDVVVALAVVAGRNFGGVQAVAVAGVVEAVVAVVIVAEGRFGGVRLMFIWQFSVSAGVGAWFPDMWWMSRLTRSALVPLVVARAWPPKSRSSGRARPWNHPPSRTKSGP